MPQMTYLKKKDPFLYFYLVVLWHSNDVVFEEKIRQMNPTWCLVIAARSYSVATLTYVLHIWTSTIILFIRIIVEFTHIFFKWHVKLYAFLWRSLWTFTGFSKSNFVTRTKTQKYQKILCDVNFPLTLEESENCFNINFFFLVVN